MITREKAKQLLMRKYAEGGAVTEDEVFEQLRAALKRGDEATAKQLAAYLDRKRSEITGEGVANAIGSGWSQGVTGLFGIPGDVIEGVRRVADPLVGAQREKPDTNSFLPTSSDLAKDFGPGTEKAVAYEPRNELEHVLQRGTSFVPGGISKSLVGTATGAARMFGLGAAAGELGNLAAESFGEENRWVGELAAIPGALITSKASGVLSRGAAKATAPTYSDVIQESAALRAFGDKNGVLVPMNVTRNFIIDISKAAKDANIHPTKNPAAWKALKAASDQLSGSRLTVGDLENVRKTIRDALGDRSPAGTAIVEAFENRFNNLSSRDVVSKLKPEATDLYLQAVKSNIVRAEKAKIIDDIVTDASKVGSSTGRRYEERLKSGFQALTAAKNYKQMWTPEERDLINLTAKGGGLPSQLFRYVRIPLNQSNTFGIGAPQIIPRYTGTYPAANATGAVARQGPTPFTAKPGLPRTVEELAAATSGVTAEPRLVPPDMEDRYNGN